MLGCAVSFGAGCSDLPSADEGGTGRATGGASAAGNAGAPAGTGSGLTTGAGTGGASSGAGGAATAGSASIGGAGGAGATSSGTSGVGGAPGGTGPTGGGAGTPGGAGGTGASGGAAPTGGVGPGGTSGAGGVAGAAGSGIAGAAGATPGDRNTPEGVCARWNGDRANLSEGTWSGNLASCVAGDISPDGRANALRLFNLYRWLADLPAVLTEASRDAQAQACALIQDANPSLSHNPPMSSTCWTQLGADGSASSNISGGPGVSSVEAYMMDGGNETTFGHRRIVLSNELGPIGLGSTGPGGASCMQNLRGTGNAGKTWMAWPSPGIIPLQAIRSARGRSLDQTGWSVQSNSINVTTATVTITAGGTNQPVSVTALTGSYGGTRYAIRIVPNGWQTTAGQTYMVSLAGISTPIAYSVQVVDCGS